MVQPCYDCGAEFVFPDASPEDAVFLCHSDTEQRRLGGLFDNSPPKLTNFTPSERPVLLGRPVVTSRTRIHRSVQEGLVSSGKERRRADV